MCFCCVYFHGEIAVVVVQRYGIDTTIEQANDIFVVKILHWLFFVLMYFDVCDVCV